MKIHAAFDGGNIEVLEIQGQTARLAIRPDHAANYFQWFYFSVDATAHLQQHLHLVNVNDSSYPEAWAECQAVASYDRRTWFRVTSEYDGKQLIIHHQPSQSLTFYAYFVPYSYERYLDFIATTQHHCAVETIATSCDGRALHLLTLGKPAPHKRTLWFIARQHAGEIMASWFIEGLVAKLLDAQDPHARRLLEQAVVYIVPHMNPDGASRGHLRANARGKDLNRQWQEPTALDTPEVFYVRQKMLETGVDFFMDVHGDETIPYVFLADAAANDSFTPRLAALNQAFSEELLRLSPDFQTTVGYEKQRFGPQNLTLACGYVADTFDAVSFTLEMPFKDNVNLPDPQQGWSPRRSQLMAEAVVQAVLASVAQLR